jgi:hypothetical protein
MAVGDLVASTTSKWGGACAECRLFIRRGDPVHKLAAEGETTRHGQGPGKWVCTACAAPAIERKDIAKRNQGYEEGQASFDIEAEASQGDQGGARGHWTN